VQFKDQLTRHVSRAATATVFAIAISAINPAAAASDPPVSHPAVAAKKLQTDLMVAALYCNEKQRYNEFVRRFEPQIAAQGNTLKQLFRQTHGNAGTTAMNTAVTRMANEASERTMADPSGFCVEHGRIFDDVLVVKPQEFTAYVTSVKEQPALANRGIAAVAAPVAAPVAPAAPAASTAWVRAPIPAETAPRAKASPAKKQ